jgi:hypothetical protein
VAKRTRKPAVSYAALTRRKLPLDLPLDDRWLSVRNAVAAIAPRYDSAFLPAVVLAEELRKPTISSARVPTSMEWGAAPPEAERLDEYYWRAHELVPVDDDVFVFPFEPGPPKPGQEVRGFVFYIWRPDFEKRFGYPQANVQTQEVPETRGRKAFSYSKLAVDLVTWLAETGALAGNKSDRVLADEFDDYCDRNKIKRPKYTQLRAWMAGIKKALFTPPETHKRR